jgi:hypothetical protein
MVYAPEPRRVLVSQPPYVILIAHQMTKVITGWLLCTMLSQALAPLYSSYTLSPSPMEPWTPPLSTWNNSLSFQNNSQNLTLAMDTFLKKMYKKKKRNTTQTNISKQNKKHSHILLNTFHDNSTSFYCAPSTVSALCNGIFFARIPWRRKTNPINRYVFEDKYGWATTVITGLIKLIMRKYTDDRRRCAMMLMVLMVLVQNLYCFLYLLLLHNHLLDKYFQEQDTISILIQSFNSNHTKWTITTMANSARYANNKSYLPKKNKTTSRATPTAVRITTDDFTNSLFSPIDQVTGPPLPPPSNPSDKLVNLLTPSLNTILHHMSRPLGLPYLYARSIIITNHPVIEKGQTAELVKKHIAQLVKLQYNIDLAPFRSRQASPLVNRLAGLKTDNCQIMGDIMSTQHHLGLVLDLVDPQWIGDQSPSQATLPSFAKLDIHAGTSEESTRFVKTYSSLSIMALRTPRGEEMSMREFSSDSLSVTKWYHFMNITVVRLELNEVFDTYIRQLECLIFSVLTEDEQESLAPRLIIAPCQHNYVGLASQVAKCEKQKSQGLCILLKNDPNDEHHDLIRSKIMVALLDNPFNSARAGTLHRLPLVITQPMPGRPPKEVDTNHIPSAMFQLQQYWIYMHNMPTEYNPHHLLIFLRWVLDAQGIHNIFQVMTSFADIRRPPQARLRPSFVIVLDSCINLQQLMQAFEICQIAMQQEQNSAPVEQEFEGHNVPPAINAWDPAQMYWNSPNLDPTSAFPDATLNIHDEVLLQTYEAKDVTRSTLHAIKSTPVAAIEQEHPNVQAQPQTMVMGMLDSLTAHLTAANEERRQVIRTMVIKRLQHDQSRHDSTVDLLDRISTLNGQHPSAEVLELVQDWASVFTTTAADFQGEDDNQNEDQNMDHTA